MKYVYKGIPPILCRIAGIILLALCLFISACSTQKSSTPELLDPIKVEPDAAIVQYEDIFNLTTVTSGTFQRTENCMGSAFYATMEYLTCDYESAILKEDLTIEMGAEVKKGDVLMTFVHDTSDAELA